MVARQDHRFATLPEDHLVKAVGIIGAIGDNMAASQPRDEVASGSHVVLLAGADRKAHRQPKCV